MTHSIAYVMKDRVLTKCGVASDLDHARAFGADCPDCLDPTRWPSEAQQLAAGFTVPTKKGPAPLDKLAGRP